MDWGTFWTAFLTSIGGTTVAVGVIAWLGDKWIGTKIEASVRHEYDKKIETHKAELEQKTAATLRTMESQFQDAVDRKAFDKDLFRQFLAVLPSSGSIEFIRVNNFAGFSFDRRQLERLEDFVHTWNNAEHEFLDPDLEATRKELMTETGRFLHEIAINTFPMPKDAHRSSVPEEWETDQPKRFEKVVDTIHTLAAKVVATHTELVRLGRERLKVATAPVTPPSAASPGGTSK
ncbi:MAG: hypothetical protein ACK54T_07020 [bacterium]|jgi:hypothetical protein